MESNTKMTSENRDVDPFLRLSIGVAEDEVQPLLATAVAFGVGQYHSFFSVTKL